jgi:hypothetical protein
MVEGFNSVDFVIDYEQGNLDDEAIVEGFQHLIDSGLCWQLQGCYGRMAQSLIQSGLCHRKIVEGQHDFIERNRIA